MVGPVISDFLITRTPLPLLDVMLLDRGLLLELEALPCLLLAELFFMSNFGDVLRCFGLVGMKDCGPTELGLCVD